MPDRTRPDAVIGPTAAPLRIVTPSEHGIAERARLVVHDRRCGKAVLDRMIDAGGSHALAQGTLPADGEYRFKLQVWRGTRWGYALPCQPLVPKAAAALARARATRPVPAPLPDAAGCAPVRVVKPSELGVDEAALLVVYDLRADRGVLRASIQRGDSHAVLRKSLPLPHGDYAWKLQVRRDATWVDATQYDLLLPEQESPEGVSHVLLPEPGSHRLVAVFQASGHKERRFNYVRPLAGVAAHRLYIRHDYGARDIDLGPLELEPARLLQGIDAVQSLLRRTCKSLGLQPADCIFAGSSKGGAAALYHGLVFGAGHILPGGPPVMFGDSVRPRMRGMPNEELDALVDWLNGLLFEQIRARRNAMPRILLHVGRGDPHHAEHAVPLKKFVDDHGLGGVELDVGDYATHGELPAHYRSFLRREVHRILQAQEVAPA